MSDEDLREAARAAIVVGVDDSEGARRALVRALEEASRRQQSLLALTTYTSPSPWSHAMSAVLDEEQLASTARHEAQRLVDEVVTEQRDAGVEAPHLQVGLRTGVAADVLCELSEVAAMLVIGRHHSTTMSTRLMSSVVPVVVTHAECPVLVV